MQLVSQSYSINARSWLDTNSTATVFSSFDKSFNLIDDLGRIFSVVNGDTGNGPFSSVVRDLPTSLDLIVSQGDKVFVGKTSLLVNSMTIDFQSTVLWCARPDWESFNEHLTLIFQNWDFMIEFVSTKCWNDCLLTMMFSSSDYDDIVGNNILKSSKLIFDGISTNDSDQVGEGVAGIAGLGVGLTPSGDDFLVGFLHALWILCEISCARKWSRYIVDIAAPKTNRLSASWLKEASQGNTSENWHKLFYALKHRNKKGISDACNQIVSIGNTSGADALAGFLLTIKTLGITNKYKGVI